jgi:hypothetical protein
MDNNLDNNNDGLEDFFRDRLSGYQDEPGADMWDRIDSCIPEKPKKNYKPILLWTGRAAAACVIFTLAMFNYQYSSQLDVVAQELQHSKDNMASLENKINDYYFNQYHPEAAVVAGEENNINTNPTTRVEQVIYRPEVVYLPMPTPQYVNAPIVEQFIGVARPRNKNIATVEQPKQHINAPIQQKEHKKGMIMMPAMAFARSAFNTAKKEDILNLKKRILNRKMAVNSKKVKSPNSRFVMKKGKWGVGNNHSGIVNNLPKSRTVSQKKGFDEGSGDSMMKTWASDGNRMLTADKHTNWDKVLGVGANYSINNKMSFFMTPDYSLEKPRSLSSNNLYEYAVGIESGLTYHF